MLKSKRGYVKISTIGITLLLLISSCSEIVENHELTNLITTNDLNLMLTLAGDEKNEIHKISEKENQEEYYKIQVIDEFSLRGKAGIEQGKKYRLSVTMKNESSNPLILYSLWSNPKSMVRSRTLAGTNGNPPNSRTQEKHDDWVTFTDNFESHEEEKFFMLSLYSESGVFLLKEIRIEEIQE